MPVFFSWVENWIIFEKIRLHLSKSYILSQKNVFFGIKKLEWAYEYLETRKKYGG